ncbi:MAG TPA: hydrogenase maturation nickel metallochaperone HypA [Anaeromyxobacter sp.]
MHEYSLVQSLVERVEREARARGAIAVHRLSVRVGELSGVDPELFRTAYETFREGTICARAPLAVTTVAASWSCPECGRQILRGAILRCPACDAPARLDDGGDALTLDGIELEVP